jgi:DNA-binding transcriptional LysR family regulator
MGVGIDPPLDLRRVRYFVAVAEELHFGRAAERLYLAQPVLSRHIQKLEDELGAQLVVRTTRSVELTEAGRQLLKEGKSLMAAAEAARRRVRAAAENEVTLTVGFWIGDFFTSAIRAFNAAWPNVKVELLRVYWNDHVAVLRDGRADVGFLHGPVDAQGLTVVPFREEPRVAVVSVDSPLAQKSEISIMELADLPVIHHAGADPVWDAFETVDPRPDGSHPKAGSWVHNLEEKLAQAAAGRAIAFLPAFVAATVTKSEVAFVPVSDIPPTRIALGWDATRQSPTITTFVNAVRSKHRSLTEQPRLSTRNGSRTPAPGR